jgi:hypothetical protein
MNDDQNVVRRRQINAIRLSWHERLIADPELHRGAGALAFAGLVLHRFHVDRGYAEISMAYAVRRLHMPESTVRRGRDLLLCRSWIIIRENPRFAVPGGVWAGTLYALGTGPDDLILDGDDAGVDLPEVSPMTAPPPVRG